MPNYQRLDKVVAGLIERDEKLRPLQPAIVERAGKQWVCASRLGEFMGYSTFEAFLSCVNRAKCTAANSGKLLAEHFIDEGAFNGDVEVLLSPWAAYAVVLEADPKKPMVATVKNYFANLADEGGRADELWLRERQAARRNHKRLHGLAQEISGITESKQHAKLDDAGYRGMYGHGVSEINRMKGVPEGEQLLDCVDHTELAANSLRMAMASEKIQRDRPRTPSGAYAAHEASGKAVRAAVVTDLGTPPEKLRLAPQTIDQLSKKKSRELRSN